MTVDLAQLLDGLRTLVSVIVPVFVAMDPIGVLPLMLSWTADLPSEERARQLRAALLTAQAVGAVFVLGGNGLLRLLGVGLPDFLVAGGVVLLVLAVSDIAGGGSHEARGSTDRPDFGSVPIGVPILAGPATLAALMVLRERYGYGLAADSLVVNLLLAWRIFRRADQIAALLGRNGLRATSKVASLLLAAIAVRLSRDGLAPVTFAGG